MRFITRQLTQYAVTAKFPFEVQSIITFLNLFVTNIHSNNNSVRLWEPMCHLKAYST